MEKGRVAITVFKAENYRPAADDADEESGRQNMFQLINQDNYSSATTVVKLLITSLGPMKQMTTDGVI